MPDVNFDGVEDATDFSPIPEGMYFVEVTGVDAKTSKGGLEYFRLEMTVTDGQYKTRKLWDNMFFQGKTEASTVKTMQRVKLIASHLAGIKCEGNVSLTPDRFLGARGWVQALIETREDDKGVEKQYNFIPYAGYHKLDDDEVPKETPTAPPSKKDDDLPF